MVLVVVVVVVVVVVSSAAWRVRQGQQREAAVTLAMALAGLPSVRQLLLWPLLDNATDPAAFAGPRRAVHDLRSLLATQLNGDQFIVVSNR